MVKLTPDLIQQSMQYVNPCRDRELSLRGYRIPMIENLGATLDQFDTIDFSDNDIRKLDGFPFLKRLSSLILNNNAVVKIGENLEQHIPNLETLILTGNMMQELGDIDPLATLPNLKFLSLLQNPVAHLQHYRAYVVYKLPQLKVLDFKKIKLKEKKEATALFKSKKGKELQKSIVKKSKFTPGENLSEFRKPSAHRAEEIKKIREAVANVSSLEEAERLQQMLQSGKLPEKETNGMEVDEYEEKEEEDDVE